MSSPPGPPPPPPPPPPPAANAGIIEGTAISAIKKVPSNSNLTTDLIMRVSCLRESSSRSYKPHSAADIPQGFFASRKRDESGMLPIPDSSQPIEA
jgi:hypothetical protein